MLIGPTVGKALNMQDSVIITLLQTSEIGMWQSTSFTHTLYCGMIWNVKPLGTGHYMCIKYKKHISVFPFLGKTLRGNIDSKSSNIERDMLPVGKEVVYSHMERID